MIDAVADSFRRYLGVCCFSAFSPNDLCGALGIRHWSSYADHHRGIVIEYDGHHRHFQDLARQKLCFPVEYCPSRTQVGLKELEIWDDATMWRYMRTWTALKSRLAWGEEKEWRLATNNGSSMVFRTGAESPDGALVFLARNAWVLGRIQQDWPGVGFKATREQHGTAVTAQ